VIGPESACAVISGGVNGVAPPESLVAGPGAVNSGVSGLRGTHDSRAYARFEFKVSEFVRMTLSGGSAGREADQGE
jgi:hypothetical protein